MTKILFFDAGPIITLVLSRLVWILPKLKEHYGGKFYITPAVKIELVNRPLGIKRFEFEALQVMKLLRDGVLEVYKDVPDAGVAELDKLANTSFKIGKKDMDIIQTGELEIVASALKTGADAVVMDERTLRLFIENNKEMKKLLKIRFKKDIQVDSVNMNKFSNQFKNLKIVRSIELIAVAYKLGLLNSYVPPQKNGKELVVDSVLWASKFNGCAVTVHEIEEIKQLLLK
jgi:hypothetical protein